MPVSKERKTAFIHIPKNGGTSIETAMGVYGKQQCLHGPVAGGRYAQHFELWEIEKYFDISDFFLFAFVRNPWSRLASEFFYLKKIKDQNIPSKWKFADFVRYFDTTKWPAYIADHLKPQSNFLIGKRRADFIFRFESFEDSWKYAKELIENQNPELQPLKKIGHKNKSQQFDLKEIYSDEMIDKVGRYYEKDVVIFDYDFN